METMRFCPASERRPRQPNPPSHRNYLISLEIPRKYTLFSLVFNDFFQDRPNPQGGLIADSLANLGDIRNTPRHVLEPLLIGLIVGNRDDLGWASRDAFDQVGQIQDGDLFSV